MLAGISQNSARCLKQSTLLPDKYRAEFSERLTPWKRDKRKCHQSTHRVRVRIFYVYRLKWHCPTFCCLDQCLGQTCSCIHDKSTLYLVDRKKIDSCLCWTELTWACHAIFFSKRVAFPLTLLVEKPSRISSQSPMLFKRNKRSFLFFHFQICDNKNNYLWSHLFDQWKRASEQFLRSALESSHPYGTVNAQAIQGKKYPHLVYCLVYMILIEWTKEFIRP